MQQIRHRHRSAVASACVAYTLLACTGPAERPEPIGAKDLPGAEVADIAADADIGLVDEALAVQDSADMSDEWADIDTAESLCADQRSADDVPLLSADAPDGPPASADAQPNPADGASDGDTAPLPVDCSATAACKMSGLCMWSGTKCVPGSKLDCEDSSDCQLAGVCVHDPVIGECVPNDGAECTPACAAGQGCDEGVCKPTVCQPKELVCVYSTSGDFMYAARKKCNLAGTYLKPYAKPCVNNDICAKPDCGDEMKYVCSYKLAPDGTPCKYGGKTPGTCAGGFCKEGADAAGDAKSDVADQ